MLLGCRGQIHGNLGWVSDVTERSEGGHLFGTGLLTQPVRLILRDSWQFCTCVNNSGMIWKSDELFLVACACGVGVWVACLLRCGGVW